MRESQTVLAIEVLCGAQGVDLRRPLRSSPAIEAVHARLRQHVPPMMDDRVLHPDIEAALALVRDGALVEAAAPFLLHATEVAEVPHV